MNALVAISIYALALNEREKEKSKVTLRLQEEVESLIMPFALEKTFGTKAVFCERRSRLEENNHWIVYPENIRGISMDIVSDFSDVSLFGGKTDFRLFVTKNLAHKNFHALKCALLVRDIYNEHVEKKVDIFLQDIGKFVLKETNQKISKKKLIRELEKFEKAIVVKTLEILYKKYNIEGNILQGFSNADFSIAEDPDFKEIASKVDAKDFSSDCYKNKLTSNLEFDVMSFIAKAYEAVYAEI